MHLNKTLSQITPSCLCTNHSFIASFLSHSHFICIQIKIVFFKYRLFIIIIKPNNFLPIFWLSINFVTFLFYSKIISYNSLIINILLKSVKHRYPELTHATPHKLRYIFSTLAYEGGASMEEISRALTHSDTKTTQAYVNAPRVVDLIKHIRKIRATFK